ncbi:Ribose transport system permease protein RbsC [Polystyrenella longa]|uniref:Ribose transport system permease protein RbsC n=1 Tax=Polystyrenella longa TaxID=2528007 RepID=A0A518CPF2_9PLAN|nr:ABC transporter permease [Polystyrenella longa]QDU81101.1 Ribose transport system permease protein RbsC [Polystyrenella longa]
MSSNKTNQTSTEYPKPFPADTKPPRLNFDFMNGLAQFGALIVIFIIFSIAEWYFMGYTSFASVRNVRSIISQTSVVAVAALGMTIIIIAGGIDLSAGTAIALSATVLAWCLKSDFSAMIAIPAAILTGMLCGALNGILISTLRVVPFIVTLGTMTLYLGIAKMVADETTIRPDKETQIPDWLEIFTSIRTDSLYLGMPSGIWLIILVAALTIILLRFTVFSRYIFALGSNESTARLCGINVPWTKIGLYSLAGLFVGLAGVYQFSRLSTAEPTSGIGLELKIIAAVVIGGGSLNGGRGSVIGTLTGSIIIYLIGNGCTKVGLTNPVQDIALGVIIIAAVTIDQLRQRRIEKS